MLFPPPAWSRRRCIAAKGIPRLQKISICTYFMPDVWHYHVQKVVYRLPMQLLGLGYLQINLLILLHILLFWQTLFHSFNTGWSKASVGSIKLLWQQRQLYILEFPFCLLIMERYFVAQDSIVIIKTWHCWFLLSSITLYRYWQEGTGIPPTIAVYSPSGFVFQWHDTV